MYIFLAFISFIVLGGEAVEQVHGVVLLACVATQSIILAGSLLWGAGFPATLSKWVIVLGIFFYITGMILLLKRFITKKPDNLAENWTNTNCIIHGALSITGLVLSVGQFVSPNCTAVLWLVVLVLFIFVEALEIVRAVQRICKYGWKQGIFTYSVTQWSRNFTFGMLDAFTLNLPFNHTFLKHRTVFESIYHLLITSAKYVVIVLFLLETALFIRNAIVSNRFQPKLSQSNNSN